MLAYLLLQQPSRPTMVAALCSDDIAPLTLYPSPIILFDGLVIRPSPSDLLAPCATTLQAAVVHRGGMLAGLLAGCITLGLIISATVFSLVWRCQHRKFKQRRDSHHSNNNNNPSASSLDKQVLLPKPSGAQQQPLRTVNNHTYKYPPSPPSQDWRRKSLPLLPTYALEPRQHSSNHQMVEFVQTLDGLTRPLLRPQPVYPQCRVVIAGTLSGSQTLPDAIRLGSDIPACYSPSIYSARASRASSSTLFAEDQGCQAEHGSIR